MKRTPRWLWIPLLLTATTTACKKDQSSANDPSVIKWRRTEVTPTHPVEATLHERSGNGEINYLGLDIEPKHPKRGEVVTLTHYFRVVRPTIGDADVFVHGELPGGGGRVLVADHTPLTGRLPTNQWKANEIWADQHRVLIPNDVGTGTIELYVGLFKGNSRFTVEAAPAHAGPSNRVRAAVVQLSGPAPSDDLPVTTVARAKTPITIDGKLDEDAWKNAEVLEFTDTLGRDRPTRFPTKLRLLYDDTHLYVGFESTDEDITERYKKRDDPIYEHETVELFLMPNVVAPAIGPYIELQSSPGGIIFDASFDGRRTGFNMKFDADQKVATTIDGTLDDPAPDKGWTTEWAVPFAKMRGVKAAPKPGDEWRMNAYRIEKFRNDGKLEGEFTAWSPPRIGDFHNVVRFGRMKFGS